MNILKKAIAVIEAAAIFQTPAIITPENLNASETNDTVQSVYADDHMKILSSAAYTIVSKLSGKYVTGLSDSNVLQFDNLDSDKQQWIIYDAGNGYCKIFSAAFPSLALTVENGNSENGNNIYLSEYTDDKSQHFMLHTTADAYYITAECSGNAALEVFDISREQGANIDQWDYWGGDNQQFYIEPADDIYNILRGDINGDGSVNILDNILIRSGCLNGFDQTTAAISDINNDGKNNSSDIIKMNNFLFGADKAISGTYCSLKPKRNNSAYLFAYFLGNDPDKERLSYAVSLDGYHFNALNNGNEVWKSDLGTGCIRDPFIFKGEDGYYYMLATDMKSSLGWNSNRNIISARSSDLINWTDESLIKIADKYPSTKGADRAWAPQAIYDPSKESYMIYWANHSSETGTRTIMYYAYSKDLKTLDTQPELLFAPESGDSAIDSDIIYKNKKYYMYYKNETNKRIYLAEAQNANGPYKEIKQISEGNIGVEGPNIYNISGTDQWLMMSDAYGNGYYVMQETADLENFTTVNRSSYSFDFTPRHGYVIPIEYNQYDDLVKAFPSDNAAPRNTGIKPVKIAAKMYSHLNMPETVTAEYSNGMTAELPVKWNQYQLCDIDLSKQGTYTVTGTVKTGRYADPFIYERADPYIVKDEKTDLYYFTASYPAYGDADKGYDRIILRQNDTVAGLSEAEEKVIWNAHKSGIMAKHIWAPEMHCINGTWYIFFAAGTSEDKWNIRPYVLKCTGKDPYNGSWSECGQMQASDGDTSSFANFSLDMTYFQLGGKHYVIWAEIKGDSSLFMAQIDPDDPTKLISSPVLLTKPEYDWEKVNNKVNEGASVLKTDSKIYIFFSASGTGSEYCIGRLEADIDSDPMDPSSWKKSQKPVLTTADLYDQAGPGHNSFVTDENGDLLLVYHARPSSHLFKECGTYNAEPLYDPCRNTHIKKVFFSEDGTPVINMNTEEELMSGSKIVTAIITVK